MKYVEVTSIAHGRLSLKSTNDLWFYAAITLPLMAVTYILVWVCSSSKNGGGSKNLKRDDGKGPVGQV